MSLKALTHLSEAKELNKESIELLKQARERHKVMDEKLEEQVRLKQVDEELLNKSCNI